MDKLKGKKIVILFHGSPYGKETTPLLNQLGEQYGFEVKDIEVPHPGDEQGSQWLQIREYKPDFVILRGWGIMNPVAMKTARRTGFPVDHIVGNIWSNSEEDVKPAGEAGVGYVAITTQTSGTELSGPARHRKDRLRRRKRRSRRQNPDRKRLPQPRYRERNPDCRSDAHRPGQVWQSRADRR